MDRGGLRLWHGMLAVGAVAVACYLFVPQESVWRIALFFVPQVMAASVVVWRTLRVGSGAGRLLWVLLAAQVGYLVTCVFWYPVPVLSGRALPFPSFVDALYFAVYATYALFLFLVLRARARHRPAGRRVALTDAFVVSASMFAVLWVTVVQPNLASGVSSPSTVVAIVYPGFTLLLFVLTARLAIGNDVRNSAPGVLMLAWVGAEIIGDTAYGLQSANGSFQYSGGLSVTWMVSAVFLAAMVSHPNVVGFLAGDAQPVADTSRLTRSARQGVLLAAALLTVVMSYADRERSLFLLGAALLAVSLVMYRTSVLARDLQRERALAVELDAVVAQLRGQHTLLESQAAQLERLAFHDSVTGLGNRALLRRRAGAVGAAGDAVSDTSLLLLDLDGFKEVNDTLGHTAGDALLLEVGDRLGRCVRTVDTVVRLGGDEFALLLPDTGPAKAAVTAERVLARLREPFHVDGVAVAVRGSIGIASGAGAGLDEMLRDADLAMYAAKNAGRDQAREFHPSMYLEATQRRDEDAEFRGALASGQLAVHYQPIVDAVTQEAVAVEALVRWRHPVRGVLAPAEFLPAAERTGLIVEVGTFVLRTACRQLVQWREEWPDLVVAVNISHQELMRPTFADDVLRVLADTGLAPDALHLEITENVLAADESVMQIIGPLVRHGVQFSIDDFGTGRSSLSRLRELNVDRLKLDRSFIAEIDDGEPTGAPLLASIISLSHSVGLTVVAEGVETVEQAAYLRAHGCDEFQGYLFSRPVPPDEVPALRRRLGPPPSTDGVPLHVSSTA
ncbi:putative bifunctional diguanylate cyclase/phosphodiesterase [Oryzobacter terrae]|uniref:putative bifunctional diguanylate cyclase/phosphodiesterase n=1 Tax=Oryzobacter terrae TaxID=1620385 RepID=UPI00366FFDB8